MQTAGTQYKSTFDAATKIYARAGLIEGLYAGITAAYLRQWMYGSFRMGIYAYLLEQTQNDNLRRGKDKNDIAFSNKLMMGCISGGIGSFIGTPSELALVRMSSDSKLPVAERRNYSNVIDCIVRISKEEGITKLWRGATPTVFRATLLGSAQMGVTSEVKGKLAASGVFGPNGSNFYGLPMMLTATLCSSFVANIVANPLDVMKSRLQSMPVDAQGKAMYSSLGDCFVKSVRAEGFMVLWSGFTPAFIKLAPYSIISLTLVDKLTKAFTGKEAM
jgi:solute carrier family 25 oxoglutarate transporter 11